MLKDFSTVCYCCILQINKKWNKSLGPTVHLPLFIHINSYKRNKKVHVLLIWLWSGEFEIHAKPLPTDNKVDITWIRYNKVPTVSSFTNYLTLNINNYILHSGSIYSLILNSQTNTKCWSNDKITAEDFINYIKYLQVGSSFNYWGWGWFFTEISHQ